MIDFIAGLPKVELHLHHVGSVPLRVVASLAARRPGGPVPADPAALAGYFSFADFADFARRYVSVVDLVRTPEDVWLMTYEMARDLAGQNVRYAEVTVTPYSTIRRGMPEAEFVAAIEDARRAASTRLGVDLRWCFDIPGDARAGPVAAELTTRLAVDGGVEGLVSLGLAGRETGFPREAYRPWFARARAAGLHSVPHAGETTGPEAVRAVLEHLGAERIGHGIGAATDPVLLAELAERRIPLEVCLTSNVATGAVPGVAGHPIRTLWAAGVSVTVNSDDPSMFGTDINREYALAADLLGLDRAGVAALAVTAVDASFMAEPDKRRLRAEIAAHLAAHPA